MNFKGRSHASGSNVAADDHLFSVMQRAYTEDSERKFIRAVNAAPEPAIVLVTDQQLNDLVRFSTTSFEFSVLTVDPTFSLGDFDVTVVTYRHLLLQSKRYKTPPVCIGPVCIHYKKTFQTYLFFASSMVGQCRRLEAVRAIGTDGEKALIEAFKHEFGFAQHLTCSLHVRRNVKEKLHKYNVSSQLSSDILSDIFGKKMGSVYVEGLVDAKDPDDFQGKLDTLTTKWSSFDDTEREKVDTFVSWFLAHKVPIIRDTMLSDVRQECGLGCPPESFTTNACEAANSVLKKKVDYKRSELSDFIEKLRELVEEQENEIERAFIGRGKYELRSQYRFLQVAETKWFAMSITQRMQHLRKVSSLTLADVEDETGNSSSSVLHCSRDPEMAATLSVDVGTLVGTARLPRNVLEGIWNKAAELLKMKDAIVSAPGMGSGAKFVMSFSGKKPHFVTVKKGGAFACDSDCPNWKGLGICSHSVAVAEQCGKLHAYIAWYKQTKKVPNLTKFAEATMPKGRGRKGGEQPRRRKSGAQTEVRVDNPALCSTTESPVFSLTAQLHPWSSSIAQSQQASSFPSQQLASFPPTWPQQGTSFPMPVITQTVAPVIRESTNVNLTAAQCSWTPNFPSAISSTSSSFTLCKVAGNITVCAGCRNRYPKSPSPPNDLCIRHPEWREYMSPTSSVPQSRFGNVYYHCNPNCVRFRVWDFLPSMLEIPAELSVQLGPEHKQHLLTFFQIHLP